MAPKARQQADPQLETGLYEDLFYEAVFREAIDSEESKVARSVEGKLTQMTSAFLENANLLR
jgi:hypothetical protein